MSLRRKLKICKTCNKACFIFSNGNCKECSSKAKPNKTQKKEPRKKLIPIAKLKKDARYWFQRWIRLRDLGKTSCYNDNIKLEDIKYYDACHYLKFELYPEAGFDEDNVHGGSKGGNIRDDYQQYRLWLIKNKGEEFVNKLEEKYVVNRQTTFKFDRAYLEGIVTKYKTLCKQIENN
jgi:hypothetical protein